MTCTIWSLKAVLTFTLNYKTLKEGILCVVYSKPSHLMKLYQPWHQPDVCITSVMSEESEMIQKQKAPPFRHLDCQFISQSACKFFLFFLLVSLHSCASSFPPGIHFLFPWKQWCLWAQNGSDVRSQDLAYRAEDLRQNDYFSRLVQ